LVDDMLSDGDTDVDGDFVLVDDRDTVAEKHADPVDDVVTEYDREFAADPVGERDREGDALFDGDAE